MGPEQHIASSPSSDFWVNWSQFSYQTLNVTHPLLTFGYFTKNSPEITCQTDGSIIKEYNSFGKEHHVYKHTRIHVCGSDACNIQQTWLNILFF